MARGTIHAPKPEGARTRRNRPANGEAVLTPDNELRGPALPDFRPAQGEPFTPEWQPETVEWWNTWRRAAQAQLFEDTDWQRLKMLAIVVDDFWVTGEIKLLAEIRMTEERLGALYTDRQRARMRIEHPDVAEADNQPGMATVTHMNDIRSRLANGA